MQQVFLPHVGLRESRLNRLLRQILTLYRIVLSPLLGARCRFHPSCSCYARTALARHGSLRGSWLTFARVLRCHPFSAGGIDPVPAQFSWRSPPPISEPLE